MKGMVFVELLAMADEILGEGAVDDIIDSIDLPSNGAYTWVGNYSCSELVTLVTAFSQKSKVPPEDLQKLFGAWMFKKFAESYPYFFEDKVDSFSMLEAIESEIHVEVRKLYSDAELPRFVTKRLSRDRLHLVYTSPRPLVHFCHGLIEACLKHFDQAATIELRDNSSREAARAEFTICLAG